MDKADLVKVLPAETPLFYENYKEPLKPVEDGYGYYGTIGLSEDKNYIQCHVCGKLFLTLSQHTRTHGFTAREYKEEYGLAIETALVGEYIRDRMIGNRQVKNSGELLPGLVKYNHDVQAGIIKHPGNGQKHRSLEQYNKEGTCPDQILDKIREVATHLGRTPGYDDYRAYFSHRYEQPVITHFGSWTNAVRMAGYEPIVDKRNRENTKEMLIAYLQDFYQRHGRTPMNSDFKRGIIATRYNYYRVFGSLNAARIEAGIPAVIPLPNRRYIEVPAEEFHKYEALVSLVPSKRVRAIELGGLKDFNWPIKELVEA